jgi:hypothetical protein
MRLSVEKYKACSISFLVTDRHHLSSERLLHFVDNLFHLLFAGVQVAYVLQIGITRLIFAGLSLCRWFPNNRLRSRNLGESVILKLTLQLSQRLGHLTRRIVRHPLNAVAYCAEMQPHPLPDLP